MATRTTRSHTPELERKADNASQPSGSTPASSATLVEVLMALLVMAIGVTSVFTLFPLAMLKSVKASQLTKRSSMKDRLRIWSWGHLNWSPELPRGKPERSTSITGRLGDTIPQSLGHALQPGTPSPRIQFAILWTSGTANPRSGFLEPSFPATTVWRPHDDDYIANRNLGVIAITGRGPWQRTRMSFQGIRLMAPSLGRLIVIARCPAIGLGRLISSIRWVSILHRRTRRISRFSVGFLLYPPSREPRKQSGPRPNSLSAEFVLGGWFLQVTGFVHGDAGVDKRAGDLPGCQSDQLDFS